jgi:ComF family protein
MASAARTLGLHERIDAVVPVPSTGKRNRERGYDPGALLAEEVSRRLGRPLRPLLSRAREAPPQSTVAAAERRRNVLGAYFASPRVRGLEVLLVDDVMTTGATAFEAARTLRGAGARGVALLVLARTPEAGLLPHAPPEQA